LSFFRRAPAVGGVYFPDFPEHARWADRLDNLTHSLIGLVAGDAVARSTRASEGGLSADTRRAFFVTVGAIGGNLPDIDLIQSYWGFERDKLRYLLEHRGYTHTLLGCVLLGILLYAGAEGWARLRRLTLTRKDRLALAGMAMLGTLLHLGTDYLNSYGVHPFWPIDDGWVYGDSVFIIEPLYWLAIAPMFFVVRTVLARVVVAIAVVIGLAANTFMHLTQPAWWIGAIAITFALLIVGKRSSPRAASLTSAALILCVTTVFLGGGYAASKRVESIAARSFPGEKHIDRVLSPAPTNPFCWDLLLVQSGDGRYTVRHGVLSNAPALIPSGKCQPIFEGQLTTAPMSPVQMPSTDEVRWLGEFSMPQARFASVVERSCDALALMQFARAPFATEQDGRWIVGDLRFDREAGLGMTEIQLPASADSGCRRRAPWTSPRAELLRVPAADTAPQSVRP
jgi:inner membrane protein